MLDVAETIVHSAVRREESRGAHQRTDFPARDDERYLAHSLAYRDASGEPRVDYLPVTITRWPPGETSPREDPLLHRLVSPPVDPSVPAETRVRAAPADVIAFLVYHAVTWFQLTPYGGAVVGSVVTGYVLLLVL